MRFSIFFAFLKKNYLKSLLNKEIPRCLFLPLTPPSMRTLQVSGWEETKGCGSAFQIFNVFTNKLGICGGAWRCAFLGRSQVMVATAEYLWTMTWVTRSNWFWWKWTWMQENYVKDPSIWQYLVSSIIGIMLESGLPLDWESYHKCKIMG